MNTQENNKLIAEFMGVFDKILSTQNIHSWSDAPFYYTTENSKEKVIENISNYVKYDTDWNWLMSVVEKIESIVWEEINDTSFNVTIGATSYCVIQDNNGGMIEIIGEGKSKLESVYNACVEFVKWYNKNK